jgi:octaprenyl-diphosphate synthase
MRTSSARLLMDIPQVLEPVRDDLDRVGERFREILADASPQSRDMVRHAARFNGKRLRPALTCVAARLGNAGVTDDVLTVAAIVELIHTATLVHDDILDGADLRRRVATLNARWSDHVAVLVGDVLFSRAYRAAAYMEDPFASRYLSDVVGLIIEGEIHQDRVTRDPDLTEEQYRRIISGKTAALYEAAVTVGSHYGGGTPMIRASLGRYGHHLGMAFQIVDDRLDLTGDEAIVGKSLGTDLAEGKMTLPTILWLADRPESERGEARTLVERAWDDGEAARELSRNLHASGALARADAAARAEIDRALLALEDVPQGEERELLARIAQFVVARSN